MSSATGAGHHAEPHGHGHDAHGHDAHGHPAGAHGSFKSYMTGFVLAVVLTAIPFWLVMGRVFESSTVTAVSVLTIGAVQIVVHMVYFLHLNAKVEGGWSLLALVFTAVLVVIMLAGSVWVMYHMNTNMMPVHDPAAMRVMP